MCWQRRGVCPYTYTGEMEKFDETRLPPKEAFAQDVWPRLNCKALGDYHDAYLLTDVGLLSDVCENFKTMAMLHYGLDPVL